MIRKKMEREGGDGKKEREREIERRGGRGDRRKGNRSERKKKRKTILEKAGT